MQLCRIMAMPEVVNFKDIINYFDEIWGPEVNSILKPSHNTLERILEVVFEEIGNLSIPEVCICTYIWGERACTVRLNYGNCILFTLMSFCILLYLDTVLCKNVTHIIKMMPTEYCTCNKYRHTYLYIVSKVQQAVF